MTNPTSQRARTAEATRRRRAPEHRAPHHQHNRASRSLIGGGPEGNERLTILTGLLLIMLFAALGITILRIGQLLWLHLFLGLALLGPIALKLLSTGYRFARYYTGDRVYRRKGPPAPALRVMAPLLVLDTLAVFASGVAMLLIGPSSRRPLLLVHKAAFILWIGLVALHVIGHLPEIMRMLRTAATSRRQIVALGVSNGGHTTRAGGHRIRSPRTEPAGQLAGRSGRGLSMTFAIVLGVALAAALIPEFGAWTHAAFGFGFHGH